MKNIKTGTIMSFIASLCFFIAFIYNGDILTLTLGGIWLLISGINLFRLFKLNKRSK